jgi:hypothetical protein
VKGGAKSWKWKQQQLPFLSLANAGLEDNGTWNRELGLVVRWAALAAARGDQSEWLKAYEVIDYYASIDRAPTWRWSRPS